MDIPFQETRPHSIHGRFWLPEQRDVMFSGELIVSDCPTYDLRVDVPHHALDDPRWGPDLLSRPFPVLLGCTRDGKPLTLINCRFYSNQSVYAAPHSTTWQTLQAFAEEVIIGAQIEDIGVARFTKFSAYFSGFNDWVADYAEELFQDPIPKPRRTKGSATIAGFGEVEIVCAGTTRHNISEFSEMRKIRFWKPVFKLSRPLALTEIVEFIRNFQRLLSLFEGGPVSFDQIRANLSGGTTKEVEIMVRMTGYKERFDRIPPDDMLVSYDSIRDSWGKALKYWTDRYDDFAPVINLYFAVVFGKGLFEEHKFLFLAQALEGYHRIKFLKTQTRFRRRLSEIIASVPNPAREFLGDVGQFAQFVTDVRDELSHPGLGKIDLKTSNLFLVWRRLKTLFEICLLRDLGIGDNEILKIARRQADEQREFGET